MTVFLVADKLLYQPILQWLESSSVAKPRVQHGISVYSTGAWTLIAVNPDSFSLGQLSIEIRKSIENEPALTVIAPSFIQYFASKMTDEAPIYQGINTLSRYPVVITEAPVFRMQEAFEDASPLRPFMHTISYASFPARMEDVRTEYVSGSRLVEEPELGLEHGVRSIAVPLLFHHSGLALQQFNKASLVSAPKRGRFERNAFDQLMLRFPSRDYNQEEVDKLRDKPAWEGFSDADIKSIWKHNRAQWDLVIEKLAMLGIPMPRPTETKTDEQYDRFTHLIASDFFELAARIDADIPLFRHVGLPVVARNGVSIPLDRDGLVQTKGDMPGDAVQQRVDTLLPSILAASYQADAKNAETLVVT